MMTTSRKKILVFLVLTFALSSVFYYLIISSGSLGSYTYGLMWCPGIAALLTQLFFQRNLRGIGWRLGRLKYWLLGYGLPLIYCLVVYGIVWLSGLGKFSPEALMQQVATQMNLKIHSTVIFMIIYVLILTTLGLLLSAFKALGEEIGWRGLLVPELSKESSFTTTALVSGGIWAVWHYPLLLFAGYRNPGAPLWFGLLCFTVMVLAFSFAFAWLRLKSGSIWPAVLLHASHNLFVQTLFTPLTANTGVTAYVIDEFGIGLALAFILIAYLFWRKRGELPLQASSV